MELDTESNGLKTLSSFKSVMNDSSMSETEDGELVDEEHCTTTKSNGTQDKLSLRARRFGLTERGLKSAEGCEKIQKLYQSMGVDNNTRLEALHLFGTDNMKAQDVFAYFENHMPASVEWITDKTCNAVWLDDKSCALALLACSVRIRGHNLGNGVSGDSSDSSDEESVKVEDLRLALPPGVWRKGHTRPLAPNLFLRFATRFDRKDFRKEGNLMPVELHQKGMVFPDEGDEKLRKVRMESSNPWSDIARQWGQFEQKTTRHRVGLRDARELIRNREVREENRPRDAREIINPDKDMIVEAEPKSGGIFGKMHADIEERKMQIKRKTARRRSKEGADLRQRISRKRRISPESDNSERRRSISSDEEEVPREKVCRKKRKRLADIPWTGYNSGESSNDSDEIEVRPSSEDLRKKLRKGAKPFIPHSPLRIEIDNDIYYAGVANETS